MKKKKFDPTFFIPLYNIWKLFKGKTTHDWFLLQGMYDMSWVILLINLIGRLIFLFLK